MKKKIPQAPQIDLFGNIGMEPTFFPDIPAKDDVGNWEHKFREYYREKGMVAYNSYFDDNNYPEHRKFIDKFPLNWYAPYFDGGSLEHPSSVYSSYNEFRKDYMDVVKFYSKYNLHPSSNICMQSEGGCHINFDLNSHKRFKNDIQVVLFCNSIGNYIYSNPSIVWMFLSPYDNQSSEIVNNSHIDYYSKGEYMTFRFKGESRYLKRTIHEAKANKKISDAWYENAKIVDNKSTVLELRFFMQPRTIEEMDVHMEFANNLMFFIKGGTFLKEKRKPLHLYTYDHTIREIKEVCCRIGFDYDKLVKVGKPELLKERFELGKKYLV